MRVLWPRSEQYSELNLAAEALISPENAFDFCHDTYSELRTRVGCIRSGLKFDVDVAAGGHWRPDRLPSLLDFMVDFQLAGREALHHSPSRTILFDMYYLGGAELQAARFHCGISELTFSIRTDEIRKEVGLELLKRKIMPCRPYFTQLLADARILKKAS